MKKTFYRNETIKKIVDEKNDTTLFILFCIGILSTMLLWGEEAGVIFFLAVGSLIVILKLTNEVR